ncbi:MAG: hypothetical protein Q9169_000566 [Polycauliona sp. 2 TL-2023]
MSGTNPFRRSEVADPIQARPNGLEAGADALHRAGIRFPPIDTGVQKSTKSKTVRIISPHYSRNRDDYGISGVISPAPQQSSVSPPLDVESPSPTQETSPIDPFSAQSDEGTSQDDEDLRRNTIANAAPDMSQNPVNLRMPLKPLKKAPALQFGGDSSTTRSQDDAVRARSIANTEKPLYDVDDFKRLLLTGEKLKTGSNSPTKPFSPAGSSQKDGSTSNTDAPSFFRETIGEPRTGVHPESPKDSSDVSSSDKEFHGLVPALPAVNAGRSRPAVPPSRHGKLVKTNVPQTISFESLSSSLPDRNPAIPQSTKPSSPTSPGSTTHLNKPLPLPPDPISPTSSEAMAATYATKADDMETTLPLPHQLGGVAAKPSPPALPSARRHGQGRSRSSTTDSNRSVSLSEDLSQNTHPSSSSSSITASKPPPLPPPRRAGTAPGLENTGPVSTADPGFLGTESPQFKPRPPAPPSRTPSTTSIRRTSQISSASGSYRAAAAPLPPAPRRRGSSQSQSSFTPSGLSGDYWSASNERSGADTAASSAQQQPAVSGTHAESKDLVADLTALQKEVDELRGKFGR